MDVKQAAVVQTTSAKRYLGQFCKHFAHKVPVELAETNTSGKVAFAMGACELTAGDEALTLRLTAPSADEMTVLRDVVERHLVRFAFRETLPIAWGG